MNKIEFWTDGAYSSKKEKGGWSFYCPQLNLRVCNSVANTTNNRMELLAAIKCLGFVEATSLSVKEVVIYSDSKYLVETMNGNYTIKTNKDLWAELVKLVSVLSDKQIKFVHVKGHADNAENNVADNLANLVSQM